MAGESKNTYAAQCNCSCSTMGIHVYSYLCC